MTTKMQENEFSSVIIQTVPLECTHRALSLEWSHLRFRLQENELF